MSPTAMLDEADRSLIHARARIADVRAAHDSAHSAKYLEEAHVLALFHAERASQLLRDLRDGGSGR